MKRTDEKNKVFTDALSKHLELTFADQELNLLNWGNADNYCYINDDLLLLAEIEHRQNHPTTNLIKVWPFLEHKEHLKIILVHVITEINRKSRNRLMLCHFFGKKMEDTFKGRFKYIYIENDFTPGTLTLLKNAIESLQK